MASFSPSVFDPYFNSVRMLHNYNTRLSNKMTFVIPKVRTNYGTFIIGLQGAKEWNDLNDDIKLLPLKIFKKNLFLRNTNNSSSLTLFFTLIFLPFWTLLVLCVSLLCVSV